METKELLRLYTLNTCEIYLIYETLFNQVEKRFKANKPVTVEHLEKCSTMYLIARRAAAVVQEFEGVTPPSNSDKRAFRHDMACEIIENARGVASL